MKEPKSRMKVPRLDKDIKDMNGKSTHRLLEKIDALSKMLDENDKHTNETNAGDNAGDTPE